MYIKGVGCTKFDSQSDASQKLAYYAVLEAIEDSGIFSKILMQLLFQAQTQIQEERDRGSFL